MRIIYLRLLLLVFGALVLFAAEVFARQDVHGNSGAPAAVGTLKAPA